MDRYLTVPQRYVSTPWYYCVYCSQFSAEVSLSPGLLGRDESSCGTTACPQRLRNLIYGERSTSVASTPHHLLLSSSIRSHVSLAVQPADVHTVFDHVRQTLFEAVDTMPSEVIIPTLLSEGPDLEWHIDSSTSEPESPLGEGKSLT